MPDGTKQEPGGWNRFMLEVADLAGTVDHAQRRPGAPLPERDRDRHRHQADPARRSVRERGRTIRAGPARGATDSQPGRCGQAARSRTWRLIRASIAAMRRSRKRTDQLVQAELAENPSGVVSTSPLCRLLSPACRIPAKPRVAGASGGALKYGYTMRPRSTPTATSESGTPAPARAAPGLDAPLRQRPQPGRELNEQLTRTEGRHALPDRRRARGSACG